MTLDAGRLVPFVDLSIINELDVIDQNPAMLDKHGEYFRDLFARWAPVASPEVADEVQHLGVTASMLHPMRHQSDEDSAVEGDIIRPRPI